MCRAVNGKRGIEASPVVGHRHCNRHHGIMELLAIEAVAVFSDGAKLICQQGRVRKGVWREGGQFKACQKGFTLNRRKARHIEFAAGGAVKRNMCADRQRNTEGPVCLHTVDVIHAARFRAHKIDSLSRFGRHLPQQLVTADASGGVVGKAGGKVVRALSRIEPPAMFFQKPGIDQRLAQPVNCLFWQAEPFIELGWCRRLITL
uniref:Predicted transcriptional regulator n=1 Tax=uncultured bacterium MedeBAC46A06 TaxID=332275 RepID=Q4PJF1_9BACT|nr:predicted transcriptional regulator [uncultured bacterium MedeBAC46A06]